MTATTLAVTASTTPATFGAEMKVTEYALSYPQGAPTSIPHLLLWLSADSGLSHNGSTGNITGWTDRSGSITLPYTAQSGNFTTGLTVTGGTSAATGLIHQDNDSGSTGTLLLTDVRGTFVSGEGLTDTSTGVATAGAPASLVITPGAVPPIYEANSLSSLPGVYFEYGKAANLVLSDLPTQATAFVVLAVVSADAFIKAGATLLAAPVANVAACLNVALSNATVNRSNLAKINGPTYAGTATTVTSGKQLIKLRMNVGTTTGAGSVNGGSDTSNGAFAPTLTNWNFIGSPTGSTFKIAGFRLHELLIYSLVQASTEDAIVKSDIDAVKDYLNGKWSIY